MSQALTLARPYARAAFSLARDAGALPAWSDALAFAARMAADPQVAALLGNPKLTQADVTTLLAPQEANETFGNFLGLLFENRRLPLLPEIAGTYRGSVCTSGIVDLRAGDFRRNQAGFAVDIHNDGWGWATGSPYSDLTSMVDDENLFGASLRNALPEAETMTRR